MPTASSRFKKTAAIAARYGEQAIEERVLRVPRLEPGRAPEVVRRGIDGLAPRERRDHFGRPVTKPERRHVDEGAVVGLEREAQVELEDAVTPEERPVTPPGITFPRSRGPSNWPLAIGAVTRVS